MKIVCIGYLISQGGAERQIIKLANLLDNNGFDVTLVIMAANNSNYSVNNGVKIIDLSSVDKKTGIVILNRYMALKKCLKKIKPNVTLNYWFQSAYFTAFMKKSIVGKVVYSERADPGDKEYSGMLGLIRKIAFKNISGFVFQSNGAMNYFNDNKIRNRSVVIPNAVSEHSYSFSERSKVHDKRIVSVGRLHPQKNHEVLIQAFNRIKDYIPDYTLEIFGEGELRNSLISLIKKYNIENRVFLKGNSNNILADIYTASAFVLSSDYEGMPNSLMEAMAIGLPCISTDCRPGAAKMLIEDGENGFIVPVNDAVLLGNKLLYLLTNQDICDYISKNAMNIRYEYSNEKIERKWIEFFLKLA